MPTAITSRPATDRCAERTAAKGRIPEAPTRPELSGASYIRCRRMRPVVVHDSVVKDQCPLRGNPNGFGLGRAADSVPLSAGGHMSPHLSSEDFCLRFASGMAELLLTAWISPLILLAKKNFSDFFTVSLFHVNRSPFHGILDGASQCLLQMRMSTQPVEHPFLQ